MTQVQRKVSRNHALCQVYNPALSPVFFDLPILNELRVDFAEVRILQGLADLRSKV
jgi:hypothetical protein